MISLIILFLILRPDLVFGGFCDYSSRYDGWHCDDDDDDGNHHSYQCRNQDVLFEETCSWKCNPYLGKCEEPAKCMFQKAPSHLEMPFCGDEVTYQIDQQTAISSNDALAELLYYDLLDETYYNRTAEKEQEIVFSEDCQDQFRQFVCFSTFYNCETDDLQLCFQSCKRVNSCKQKKFNKFNKHSLDYTPIDCDEHCKQVNREIDLDDNGASDYKILDLNIMAMNLLISTSVAFFA